MQHSHLIDTAWQTREHAHACYSQFKVGAAVETCDGQIFSGCNVENLSYGLTMCAERVAILSAVAAGHRHFSRIAIVADTDQPISPCGACRQVMSEFSISEVILANRAEQITFSLQDLLPRASTGILNH